MTATVNERKEFFSISIIQKVEFNEGAHPLTLYPQFTLKIEERNERDGDGRARQEEELPSVLHDIP